MSKGDEASRFAGLDRAEDALSSVGLILSGVVFAAGLAALLFVMMRIIATSPPSSGSQGEWLYAAMASLLVAGWGFSQAAKFYARRRRAETANNAFRMPDIEFRPDGLSVELNPRASDQAHGGARPAWSWSFSFDAAPIKTIELKEEQIAEADAAARRGADWDEVALQLNPQYAGWSPFEQRLYRQALQASVEHRRRQS